MKFLHRSIQEQFLPLLAKVQKPSRYVGQEWGTTQKTGELFHVCLMYPDVYEVGQANLGLSILYHELNAASDIFCERSYVPWIDMARELREAKVPLPTLETCAPVASCEVVGFTLAHELAFTNILEALDLAQIPLTSCERTLEDPFVIGGGPSVWNCEPIAPAFDAVILGDGEGLLKEICEVIKDKRNQGHTRQEILEALSRLAGVYVPSFYEAQDPKNWFSVLAPKEDSHAPKVVYKHVIQDFAATPCDVQTIVPYMDVVQNRLSLEILRGCARGCRFCQAGMTYRPVRERPRAQIVTAACGGLQVTGYDEISLSSLSTTDYSQCAELLHDLSDSLKDTGVKVSIPSQRLDAFGARMALEVSQNKKGGLTFAPEAGSQRLRDVINKNVTDDDIERAAHLAFSHGWKHLKLYFMMGLPTETDEDILGIAKIAQRVLEIGRSYSKGKKSKVEVHISVAVFVPKAYTPFQWVGQLTQNEVRRRQKLLREALGDRALKLAYHDAEVSTVEAALSKLGRPGFALVEQAWKAGCVFDAWTDCFSFERWEQSARKLGVSLFDLAEKSFGIDDALPWEVTSPGVSKGFLKREYRSALEGITCDDCTMTSCTGCGVCPVLNVHNSLCGTRKGAQTQADVTKEA